MSAWHPDWPGFNARGTLLLPLPTAAFAELAPSLELDGLVLTRKREFHVTLLDRALAARMLAPTAASSAAARLPALFALQDWRWQRGGERWLLRESKDGVLAHSLIELIQMPALAKFRHAVAGLLGEPLPPTPAHVSLYTAGCELGIGLASEAEFERLRLHRL